MKRFAIILTAALLVISISAFVGCSKKDDGVKVLKLAHGLDTEHPVHKAMVFMGEKVNEKSNGTMRVDIYPSEQLGNERDCIQQLQFGGLAMTKTSSSPLESFIDEMKILGLPYLFRDSAHYWKVLQGPIGEELLAAGEDKGLKGLCFYDAGARSFYTVDTPVRKPEDLQKLKIRVQQSPIAMELVKTLGASPTPIGWGELYTSLQQGVVDGAENNPPSFDTSLHYEVCKYYTLDEHTRPPDVLLISTKIWKGLTGEQQKILQDAADESVEYEKELWAEETKESLKNVEEAGVQIIRPDKQAFREASQPMLEKYRNSDLGSLIERIEQVE